MRSWAYIRLLDRDVYAKFNKELWTAFEKVTAKQVLVQSRLYAIAYEEPSAFTKHCRQYLGEDYFNTMEAEAETDDSEVGNEGTVGDEC